MLRGVKEARIQLSSKANGLWRDPRVRVSAHECVCVQEGGMLSVPGEGVPLKMCVNVARSQHIDAIIT